jgi:hypothetical protein
MITSKKGTGTARWSNSGRLARDSPAVGARACARSQPPAPLRRQSASPIRTRTCGERADDTASPSSLRTSSSTLAAHGRRVRSRLCESAPRTRPSQALWQPRNAIAPHVQASTMHYLADFPACYLRCHRTLVVSDSLRRVLDLPDGHINRPVHPRLLAWLSPPRLPPFSLCVEHVSGFGCRCHRLCGTVGL